MSGFCRKCFDKLIGSEKRLFHGLLLLEYPVSTPRRVGKRRILVSTQNERDSKLICSAIHRKDRVWAEANDDGGHDIFYPCGFWFRFASRRFMSFFSLLLMFWPFMFLALALMAFFLFPHLLGAVLSTVILIGIVAGLWYAFHIWLRAEHFSMNDMIFKFVIGLCLAGCLAVVWFVVLGRSPDMTELVSSLWIFIGSNAIWLSFIQLDRYYLEREDLAGKLMMMERFEALDILDREVRRTHKWW